MTEPDHATNIPVFTVSELAGALKRTVEESYANVRVRGEISGLKRAGSGHVYLSLKDDKAVLDGVIWRGPAAGLTLALQDGLEVIAHGRLTTYPARSKYQLVIESLEPAGVGALLALLEERRKMLAAEGLFDAARKRPLPFLPAVIGVVTSPTGAVIRDILHRLRDRFPRPVLLWPVLVQGQGAAEQIAAAIKGFNALPDHGPVPRPDLLIVARGGGSIEDLWAFNEEIVVRAAAESRIPLISAVGHETDTTLIDYAADVRAPTPSAAAEMAVPVRADLLLRIGEHGTQLGRAVLRLTGDRRHHLDGLARGLPRPQALIGEARQRLDDSAQTVRRVMVGVLERRRARLDHSALRLRHPREAIAQTRARLALAARTLVSAAALNVSQGRHGLDRRTGDRRFERALERVLADRRERLRTASRLLASHDYHQVLRRGYAVVRDIERRIIASPAAARAAGQVSIEFTDGEVGAAIAAGGGPARPRRGRAPAGGQDPQGSLI